MSRDTDSTPDRTPDVQPLRSLPGHRLAEDTLDVRGWVVTTPAFFHVGVVSDLLVDVRGGFVRYLEVALEGEPGEYRRLMLLPIGKVAVDDALDRVVIAVPECLDSPLEYDPTTFTREYERELLASHGEEGAPEPNFYDCPAFDVSSFRRATPASGEEARSHHPRPSGDAPATDALGNEIRVEPAKPEKK